MVFEYCPLVESGLCQSEREREEEIYEQLRRINWIRSDAEKKSIVPYYDAAVLLIVQRPPPPKRQKLLEAVWEAIFPQKKKPVTEVSDDSLLCFGPTYEWSVYKSLRKSRLLLPSTMRKVREKMKEGFDVQVVIQKREKLHRPGDKQKIPHTVAASFDDFCEAYKLAVDSSFSSLK